MNRKSFLKKLGIGVATIIVAPKVIAENPNDSPKRTDWDDEVGKTYPAFNRQLIDKRIAELKIGVWIPVKKSSRCYSFKEALRDHSIEELMYKP